MGELTNQVSNRADYFFYSTVFALTGRYDSPSLLADGVDLNQEGYGEERQCQHIQFSIK